MEHSTRPFGKCVLAMKITNSIVFLPKNYIKNYILENNQQLSSKCTDDSEIVMNIYI